jgi:hypothetical protein
MHLANQERSRSVLKECNVLVLLFQKHDCVLTVPCFDDYCAWTALPLLVTCYNAVAIRSIVYSKYWMHCSYRFRNVFA